MSLPIWVQRRLLESRVRDLQQKVNTQPAEMLKEAESLRPEEMDAWLPMVIQEMRDRRQELVQAEQELMTFLEKTKRRREKDAALIRQTETTLSKHLAGALSIEQVCEVLGPELKERNEELHRKKV